MSGLPVTPFVLTWNERANIERVLGKLQWAERVLVVDSESDDGTQDLARSFDNVVLVERPFTSHADQANFAICHEGIETDWVLALDADFVLSDALSGEVEGLQSSGKWRGFEARVRYCIDGKPLRSSLYPPTTVLFDRRASRFVQFGHAHKVVVDGPVGRLVGEVLHDDRKTFERFLDSQRRYAPLEAERIRTTRWSELRWSGRIRKLRWVAPWLVPLFVLFGKGLALDGRPGLAYARQRWIAERMIARELRRRT